MMPVGVPVQSAHFTQFGARVRAVILVALLIGGLFPSVFGISVATLAAVVAFPLIINEFLRKLPRVHSIVPFVVLVFGAIGFHALYVSPATPYGAEKIQRWFSGMILSVLAVVLVRGRDDLRLLSKTWVVAALGLAALAILGYDGDRSTGIDSNPIWLARAIQIGVIFGVWRSFQGLTTRRVTLITLPLMVLGVITTGSRGPVLSLVAAVVILVLYTSKRRLLKAVLVALSAGVAYLSVLYLPLLKDNRFAVILAEGGVNDVRGLMREATLAMIMSHPKGVGIGNWSLYANLPPQYRYPHNIFLEIAAEQGVVLGALFLIMVACVVLSLLRRAQTSPESLLLAALLIGEIFNASVSGDLIARTFFFVLGLGLVSIVSSAWRVHGAYRTL